MISRPLKIIGLSCKRALQKRLYSAKETYHFKEPTNRSHPQTRSLLVSLLLSLTSTATYVSLYTLYQRNMACGNHVEYVTIHATHRHIITCNTSIPGTQLPTRNASTFPTRRRSLIKNSKLSTLPLTATAVPSICVANQSRFYLNLC